MLSFIRSDNQRKLYLHFFDSLLAVLNSTSKRKSFAMASLLGVCGVKRNVERLGWCKWKGTLWVWLIKLVCCRWVTTTFTRVLVLSTWWNQGLAINHNYILSQSSDFSLKSLAYSLFQAWAEDDLRSWRCSHSVSYGWFYSLQYSMERKSTKRR